MGDDLSQEWSIVASWVGAIAAWIGSAVVLLAERRRRQERAAEMAQKYSELAGDRETFWTALRDAYSRYRQSCPHAPEQLESLIRAAGVPHDLAPRKGRDLRQWPAENAGKLGPDQRIIWEFVSIVYPARQGRQGYVSDYSFITLANAKAFHQARGNLARFWNAWVPSLSMKYLFKHYTSACDQLAMLSWLEIALIQWTEDQGEGKVALFMLAQKLSQP